MAEILRIQEYMTKSKNIPFLHTVQAAIVT